MIDAHLSVQCERSVTRSFICFINLVSCLLCSDCLEGSSIDSVLSGLNTGFDKSSLLDMVKVISN